MCIPLEKADFLTGWGYQKILSENVILEKAFSDNRRSGFLVPYKATSYAVKKIISENDFSDTSIFQQDFPKHPFLSYSLPK